MSLMPRHNSESLKLQQRLRPRKHLSTHKLMLKLLKSLKSMNTMTHGTSNSSSKGLRPGEQTHGLDLQKEGQKLRDFTNRKALNLKLPLNRFSGILPPRVIPLFNRCSPQVTHKLPRLMSGQERSRNLLMLPHLNPKTT